MFAYPKQAEVNRVVSKVRICAHAKASKRVKELFTTQVAEIRWKYKLSPETINLPARDGINEIQIFDITVKTQELDDAVLLAIEKAIPFPLCFRLIHADQVQFAAAFKRPSDGNSSKWVVEATFRTAPEPINSEWPSLPVALDLAGLYEQLVRRHISLPARTGEGIRDHVARFQTIAFKEGERVMLELQLRKEKHFNRKVQMNAALRSLSQQLKNLMKH